ncbi:MAG: hypothetical protein ACR2L1_09005 [Pyrinomonadaceae bacterium]
MKSDETKKEYDFSIGTRGMFRGLVEDKKSDLPKTKGLAVCVKTDNQEILRQRKIYNAVFIGDDLIQVTDESGEEAIYSANCFLRIKLPAEIENIIEKFAA